MTEDQKAKRREYMREYRAKNKDKIKEQERNSARRRAFEAITSVKRQDTKTLIIRAADGREYFIGGRV